MSKTHVHFFGRGVIWAWLRFWHLEGRLLDESVPGRWISKAQYHPYKVEVLPRVRQLFEVNVNKSIRYMCIYIYILIVYIVKHDHICMCIIYIYIYIRSYVLYHQLMVSLTSVPKEYEIP